MVGMDSTIRQSEAVADAFVERRRHPYDFRRNTLHPENQMMAVLLLIAANLFMTLAWYGHLRFPHLPLGLVILVSWLIALPEYCMQVPGNRFGHRQFTAAQLLILREVISVCVSLLFFVFYLRESPRWNEWLALALIVGAVLLFNLGPPRIPKATF